MIRHQHAMIAGNRALARGLIAGLLLLSGCGAEGEGTIKPAGPPPTEDALGRPFGNAPGVPTRKSATKKAKTVVPEAVNPKLRG